ncbi:LAGLIDADG family homing endonuclease [Parageobacillus galactosidasius]|uniref:DOD-type homing endonuclease domain-containing protein n=1 Tax=Parageobacillus galactosidasius TaxID=883812 RepID=A0A226QQF5_9BACL|nr:LAGLIDADG family homing endonuclease [Parageobacillus galactosidasius]OXB94766.1 hypothetical protein B9L23_07845 [Parageobacillus galactosidasius]
MNKKYQVNENFFKTWTEESAYILGWIMSDGCINYIPQKKYEIRFELADLEAIQKIRKAMGSNHPIRERNDKGSKLYGLYINSKKLVKQLLDLGVHPNKAKRLNWPNIPKEYEKDFIRGFFDGDGSVRINNKKNNRKQLTSFFGSICKPFLEKLGQVLRDEIELIPKIYEDTPGFYKLHYGGKESHALYRYMYKDATIYLNRKKEKFEEAIEIKAGIGLAKCKRCGEEIVRTSNRQKWCADCKKEVLREQWRKKYQRQKARRSQKI